MTKYNKALVAVVMALVYFINQKYGVELPFNEAEANLLVGLLTSILVWAIPNKAPKE